MEDLENKNILNERDSTLLIKENGESRVLGATCAKNLIICCETANPDECDADCPTDSGQFTCVCTGTDSIDAGGICLKTELCSCDAETCSCDAETCSCDSDSCSSESCIHDFTPICSGETADFQCDDNCPLDSSVCTADAPITCSTDAAPIETGINPNTIEYVSIGNRAVESIWIAGHLVWGSSQSTKYYFPFRLIKEGAYLDENDFYAATWQQCSINNSHSTEYFDQDGVGYLRDGDGYTVFWVSADTASFASGAYVYLLNDDDYEYVNSVIQTPATAATLTAFTSAGINNIIGTYTREYKLNAIINPGSYTVEGLPAGSTGDLYWEIYIQTGSTNIMLSNGHLTITDFYDFQWGAVQYPDEPVNLAEHPELYGQSVQIHYSTELYVTIPGADGMNWFHSDSPAVYQTIPAPTQPEDDVIIPMPSFTDT